MKKVIGMMAAFVLCTFASSAEPRNDVSYRAKSGDNALLFKLRGLSDLGVDNFDGGIGYQYYFGGGNHVALRFGLGANYSLESQDKPEIGTKDYRNTVLGFSFYPGIRYNFGTSSNILAYMGTELIFAINNEKEEGRDFTDIIREEKANTYGAGFFLGAEWFVVRNVSLSAEYSLRFLYETAFEEITISGIKTKNEMPDKFSFGTGTSSLYFTIGFYFD